MSVQWSGIGLSTSRQGGINEQLKTCCEAYRPADGHPSAGPRGSHEHYPQGSGTRPVAAILVPLGWPCVFLGRSTSGGRREAACTYGLGACGLALRLRAFVELLPVTRPAVPVAEA